MLTTIRKKVHLMVKGLDEGEGMIVLGMQWILRFVLITFLLISVPLFLYIMWLIPSL